MTSGTAAETSFVDVVAARDAACATMIIALMQTLHRRDVLSDDAIHEFVDLASVMEGATTSSKQLSAEFLQNALRALVNRTVGRGNTGRNGDVAR